MQSSNLNLPLLVVARVCTTAVFMTYPACLRVLLVEWDMTASQGGLIQGAFTAAFAVSLLGASYLCDRSNAKAVFRTAILLTAIASLVFAALAFSFETALIGAVLLGFAQGGTYTPAIILASLNARPGRGATAIGWVLAGMSAGYVVSIFLSTTLLETVGYGAAFWVTGALPTIGCLLGFVATRNAATQQPEHKSLDNDGIDPERNRRSKLLIVGYVGHCWELFGAWAWLPAFIGIALVAGTDMSSIELGLWVALIIHASGFFASFVSGFAADQFGAKRVLVLFAALGTVCSVSIGWIPSWHLPLLLVVAAVYGFMIIGDSAILSSAMVDTVPQGKLGGMLGLRSVLGVGAGSISPIVFGATLDLQTGLIGWGLAFTVLGLGGAVATYCALRL